MSTNNKTSNLINSQVPFFVRNDHPKFIQFLEAYYKFLEQTSGALDVKENIISFTDIDYLTRNDDSYSYTISTPTSLVNTSAVQANSNTGNIGIPAMILRISVMGSTKSNTSLTGVDRNLYDFLATGSSNTANLADSYADINGNKIVNATDAGLWANYTYNTPGTTGNVSIDLRAANIVAQMISFQNQYPGYFNTSLFNYTNVDVVVPSTSTPLEIELQEKLYETFLKFFPKELNVDKALLLKHAKEFYVSRGSEKSIRFLMNVLLNKEELSIYYPKDDILRPSDGKWYVEKSLRVTDTRINNVSNSSIYGLEKFVSTQVRGNTSGATAVVERVDRFYEGGTLIDELVISGIRGTFDNGEQVFSLFTEQSVTKSATANVFGGVLNTITITNPGSGYNVGDPVIIESATGNGANVQIARVSSGNIASITVIDGGAGYRINDPLLISGGGGAGAAGTITLVDDDGRTHPNTYNIFYSQIFLEANTNVSNAIYSNLNPAITDPANNWIANSLSSFVYANTGPAATITISNPGSGYTSLPSIGVVANTRINELGILGHMRINNGGLGYQIGDIITFTNVMGGYGTGAAANVRNVAANGSITDVRFVEVPGHIIGGAGYSQSYLPIANVVSANANAYGANIAVTAVLGSGGEYIIANTTLGAIERMIIIDRGSGYITPPTLNLTQGGDGTAKANATVIEGVYTYPGRYLNDDGFLSSYNFLQDRDYYQNFSYVLRLKASVEEYRQALKNLIHPAGMKMFGTYVLEDMSETTSYSPDAEDSVETSQKLRTYLISNNAIINYTGHGFSVNDEVTIQFTSGNIANFAANVSTYKPNGIYKVANVINANAFTIFSGKYLPGSINVAALASETGPSEIYMKEDGYNMFLIGSTNDRVIDFKLRRQYDITSAYLNKRSPSLAAGDGSPTGLTFKPDGTIFYVSGTTNDRIIQYNMSESWNVNSATQGLSFNVNTAFSITNPQAVQISRDGNYMYFVDSGTDIVYQLQLSEAWNVNTASYLTQKSIATFENAPTGLYFNANGTSMYVVGQQNDRVKEFRLSAAWNVNTATIYANSGSFGAFSSAPNGLAFANNGSMLYIVDSTYDLIHQLPMTEAWNVNTAFNGTSTTGNVIVGVVV